MVERSDFDEFVLAASPKLHRTAYLLTRERAAAQDLVQTALMRAWRRWAHVDGDPYPYVRRILVNAYAGGWRQRFHEKPASDREPPAVGADAAAAFETRDALWRALGQLPPRTRAVVVLRYFEDLTEADTAAALGISIGTVKSQCSRGLAKLRVAPDLTTAATGSFQET